MMTPERWIEIERLLDVALEHDPAAWPGLLDEACADDPALRREVEDLLHRYPAAEHFLQASAASAFIEAEGYVPPSREGHRIGSYRILREVGHGGMGKVYLAERADGQFEQQVALKLLRPGFENTEMQHRFRTERQILASLNHAHIAQLLDGGITDDGQPYLAMEYIDGHPIDQYCDEHRLSIRERLQLFATVAEATQYAHRNLIVHRDLKPSNILVTEQGQVKLLDFGIAKLLDEERATPPVPRTGTGQRWMTPEYAAPEQIRGEAVTTATDVYQLGVVLYELLTGHRPFERTGENLHRVEQAVLDEEPTRPSTAITRRTERGTETSMARIDLEAVSRARRTQPDRLRKLLQGDLDTMALKALRKEPEARYASAEAFVEDIKRYLAGLPVTARHGTLGYRTRKFVQRHRWGVGAAVVFAALLGGYAVTVTVQAGQVRRALDHARLENAKAGQVTDFLMGLFEANDPREARGDAITARELLTRGLEQVEALGDEEVQAEMLDVVGRVYQSLGQYDKAQPLLERALAMRRALLGETHLDVAASLNNLALVLKAKGSYEAAESFFREALAMRQDLLGAEHPDVAASLNNLGMVLHDRGDYEAAEPLYRASLAMRQHLLGEEHPDVAAGLNNLGLLLMEKGDYDEAEALHREALALRRKLFGEVHPDITYSLNNLALVLHNRGDYDAAEPLYRELLAMDRKLLGEEHPDVALDLNNLAGLLGNKGNYDQAEALHREALALRKKTLGEEHPHVAQSLNNLAGVLFRKSDYDQAAPLYREALAMRRKILGEEHPGVATTLDNLAMTLNEKGDYEAAEPLSREALAIRRRLLGDEHPDVARNLHNLAALLNRKGDHKAAEPLYREAVSIQSAALGDRHWVTAYFKSGLGTCLRAQTRYEEAEPLLLDAHTILRDERGDQDLYTQRVGERLIALYEAWSKPDEAAAYRRLLANTTDS